MKVILNYSPLPTIPPTGAYYLAGVTKNKKIYSIDTSDSYPIR